MNYLRIDNKEATQGGRAKLRNERWGERSVRCKTHTGRDERDDDDRAGFLFQDLSRESGLSSDSRSGPPLSETAIDISIRTSIGIRDFFPALDQDLSRDSGLLSISRSGPLSVLVSGSRSGPLSGVGTSFGLSIRTSSLRTSINVSIRTSLGIRDFFRALDQDLLSWGLFRDLDEDLSRRGLLSGTSFQISIRTSFGISIGA